MDESIEAMILSTSKAIGCGQYKQAVEICSRFILAAEAKAEQDIKHVSLLYSYRGYYRLLTKEFHLTLHDCDKAIDMDATNLHAHIQKCQALFALKRVNEAKQVMQVARTLSGDQQLLIDLEVEMNDSWLNLVSIAELRKYIVSWFVDKNKTE